jgi:hypothetical protein
VSSLHRAPHHVGQADGVAITAAETPGPVRRWRCRVETSFIGRDFSRALGIGAIVDLEQVLAPGVRLRDVVDTTHFEEI